MTQATIFTISPAKIRRIFGGRCVSDCFIKWLENELDGKDESKSISSRRNDVIISLDINTTNH
jgi:hypothetical protein